RLAAYLVLSIASVAVVRAAEKAAVYSPYYALSVKEQADGILVLTNGSLHQEAMDLRASAKVVSERHASVRSGYHAPYRMLRAPPKRVLVLGAGSGNDVAVALDEGAEHVDVVEIDPEIIAIGRRSHPARPYDSERVTIHVTDARAFLNDTHESF